MDRFELVVSETAAHERRQPQVLAEKTLGVIEQQAYCVGEGRHERRIVRGVGGGPDPVRRLSEFSAAPLLTAHTLHENGVDIADQTEAKRHGIEELESRTEGNDVVPHHLSHVATGVLIPAAAPQCGSLPRRR